MKFQVKSKILIVDDVAENLALLTNLLNPEYEIFFAKNGLKTIEIATRNKPDLILLDIVMPGMDGYEVCRRIKNDAATGDIPVIFLSALDDVHDIVNGFRAGGVDYITKPFQSEEVLARVETQLKIRKLQQELEKSNVTLRKINTDLELALEDNNALRGILPICSNCKNIRNDRGYWEKVEIYIRDHSAANFSHSICPDCARKLYPQLKLP